ncbi:CHAP domain-containing protein [Bifidobacterium tsurumiense]|nr:CHAP domain-containing protein [Bifidobacterium tsurumiense]MSS12179.1 CHAP domain-containing protein [Bifidobacterium tsurumiense]
MKHTKCINTVAGLMLSAATILTAGLATTVVATPQAEAITMQEYQQKVQNNETLKAQLAGVNEQLANVILELSDLTENQIPAAQQAAEDAEQNAQQAQQLADATNERLQSAKQDKADLEAKIEQTGADYDDAKEEVANLARQSLHGSTASDVMDVVTNSTTTEQFVDKMQSEAAVTRSESNAADDAANELSTSMNRKERLTAIENRITKLKEEADQQAASAQQASEDAAAKQASLQALRDKGSAAREQLESQKSSLTTQQAREAAEIVAAKSQIDSYNTQNYGGATADPSAGGQQQVSNGGSSAVTTPSTPSNSSGNTGSASGMNYSVPGSCPEGSGFCYGHSTGNTVGGSAYPARQCTLWAYIRRSQLGLPVGSYMGNGAEWANTARSLGYLVNNTPHVGAAVVFARGQSVGGHWTADWQYGHVAIVERVNADGSILISEGGTGFSTFPAWETLSNPGAYQYVHY